MMTSQDLPEEVVDELEEHLRHTLDELNESNLSTEDI